MSVTLRATTSPAVQGRSLAGGGRRRGGDREEIKGRWEGVCAGGQDDRSRTSREEKGGQRDRRKESIVGVMTEVNG